METDRPPPAPQCAWIGCSDTPGTWRRVSGVLLWVCWEHREPLPHPILARLRIELLRTSLEIAAERHERLRRNWENARRGLLLRDIEITKLHCTIKLQREVMCPVIFGENRNPDRRAVSVQFDAISARKEPERMLGVLRHVVETQFRGWLSDGTP